MFHLRQSTDRQGQPLAILPFLMCLFFILCSRNLFQIFGEGHQEDIPVCFTYLVLVLAIAVAAPASVHLTHLVGSARTQATGACVLSAGLLIPLWIHDIETREIVFALLFGVGLSMIFQASVLALSPLFSSLSPWWLLFIPVLSTVIMATAQSLIDLAILKLSEHGFLAMWGVALVVCVGPSTICIRARNGSGLTDSTKNVKQSPSDVSQGKDITNILLKKEHSMDLSSEIKQDLDNGRNSTNLYCFDLAWRASVLAVWAPGINLLILTKVFERHPRFQGPSVLCMISLLTLLYKNYQDRRHLNSSDENIRDNSSSLMLVVLGIYGILLWLCPFHTDPIFFSLIFAMGFFLQVYHHRRLLSVAETENKFDKLPVVQTSNESQSCCQTLLHNGFSAVLAVDEFCVEAFLSTLAVCIATVVTYPLFYIVSTTFNSAICVSGNPFMIMCAAAITLSLADASATKGDSDT